MASNRSLKRQKTQKNITLSLNYNTLPNPLITLIASFFTIESMAQAVGINNTWNSAIKQTILNKASSFYDSIKMRQRLDNLIFPLNHRLNPYRQTGPLHNINAAPLLKNTVDQFIAHVTLYPSTELLATQKALREFNQTKITEGFNIEVHDEVKNWAKDLRQILPKLPIGEYQIPEIEAAQTALDTAKNAQIENQHQIDEFKNAPFDFKKSEQLTIRTSQLNQEILQAEANLKKLIYQHAQSLFFIHHLLDSRMTGYVDRVRFNFKHINVFKSFAPVWNEYEKNLEDFREKLQELVTKIPKKQTIKRNKKLMQELAKSLDALMKKHLDRELSCSNIECDENPTVGEVLKINTTNMTLKRKINYLIKTCNIHSIPPFLHCNDNDIWTTEEAIKLWGLTQNQLNKYKHLAWKGSSNYYLSKDLIKIRREQPWIQNPVQSQNPEKNKNVIRLSEYQARHAIHLPEALKMMVDVWEEFDEESNYTHYHCAYDGVPKAEEEESKASDQNKKKKKKPSNSKWPKLLPYINENGIFDRARFKFVTRSDVLVYEYKISDPIESDEEQDEQEIAAEQALPPPALGLLPAAFPAAPPLPADLNEDEEYDSDAEMKPADASQYEEEEQDIESQMLELKGQHASHHSHSHYSAASNGAGPTSVPQGFGSSFQHAQSAAGSQLGFFGGFGQSAQGEGKDAKSATPHPRWEQLMLEQENLGIPLDDSLPSSFSISDLEPLSDNLSLDNLDDSLHSGGIGLPTPGSFFSASYLEDQERQRQSSQRLNTFLQKPPGC